MYGSLPFVGLKAHTKERAFVPQHVIPPGDAEQHFQRESGLTQKGRRLQEEGEWRHRHRQEECCLTHQTCLLYETGDISAE